MEKVAEAKVDSLDTIEDPLEDLEDRLEVDLWSLEEASGGR